MIAGWKYILHRHVPRWSFPLLWYGCTQVQQYESGTTHRPDGGGVPAGNQMYLPQIRCFRDHSKVRRPLRSRPQHPQREDLHLPLVLVHNPGGIVRCRSAV